MQVIDTESLPVEGNALQNLFNQQFQTMANLVELDREIAALEQRASDLKVQQRLLIQDISARGQEIGRLNQEAEAKK
jgi:flagellar biosynthesis/type III secretory pathway chaperone